MLVDKVLLCVVITRLWMSQEREVSLIQTEDNPQLFKWMEKSQDRFTGPEIQNENLSIMALHILREITSELSGKCYTIMVDETTDLPNTE